MNNFRKNQKGDKKRGGKILQKIIVFAIILAGLYFGIFSWQDLLNSDNTSSQESLTIENVISETGVENLQEVSESSENNFQDSLKVYMIDCGQADSFLFVYKDQASLIDCGTSSTGSDVVEFIRSLGIIRLEFVLGTHPHDDHMGGMEKVLNNFEVGKIIYPEVKADLVTKKWYINLLKSIKEKSLEVVHPSLGDEFYLGDVIFKVMGPISYEGDNINDYSIVTKVTFGQSDILMMGDAEKEIEEQILSSNENIDVEVLKVGHHGSDTSTSDELLDATSPKYALISCGVGNSYNHPKEEIIDKFEERNIPVYRTDEEGTVEMIVSSNPDGISFDKEPGDYLSGPELEEAKK